MNTLEARQDLIGRRISVAAHAKLNLRLKITGRRADGFHLLSMINSEISLADQIAITFKERAGVRFEPSDTAADEAFFDAKKNLAVRAAELYLQEARAHIGLSLSLQKVVPIGAGLGGGSSDAAAVLSALHAELRAPSISRRKLFDMAAVLGSDVPYFLQRGLCHVTGTGDKLRSLSCPELNNAPVLLFLPKLSISTPELYALYRKRFPYLSEESGDVFETADLSYQEILGLVQNDFEILLEEFAPQLWTEINEVRKIRGLRVSLTGSGSAYFGLPEVKGELSSALRQELETGLRSNGTKVLSLRLLGADEQRGLSGAAKV